MSEEGHLTQTGNQLGPYSLARSSDPPVATMSLNAWSLLDTPLNIVYLANGRLE